MNSSQDSNKNYPPIAPCKFIKNRLGPKCGKISSSLRERIGAKNLKNSRAMKLPELDIVQFSKRDRNNSGDSGRFSGEATAPEPKRQKRINKPFRPLNRRSTSVSTIGAPKTGFNLPPISENSDFDFSKMSNPGNNPIGPSPPSESGTGKPGIGQSSSAAAVTHETEVLSPPAPQTQARSREPDSAQNKPGPPATGGWIMVEDEFPTTTAAKNPTPTPKPKKPKNKPGNQIRKENKIRALQKIASLEADLESSQKSLSGANLEVTRAKLEKMSKDHDALKSEMHEKDEIIRAKAAEIDSLKSSNKKLADQNSKLNGLIDQFIDSTMTDDVIRKDNTEFVKAVTRATANFRNEFVGAMLNLDCAFTRKWCMDKWTWNIDPASMQAKAEATNEPSSSAKYLNLNESREALMTGLTNGDKNGQDSMDIFLTDTPPVTPVAPGNQTPAGAKPEDPETSSIVFDRVLEVRNTESDCNSD